MTHRQIAIGIIALAVVAAIGISLAHSDKPSNSTNNQTSSRQSPSPPPAQTPTLTIGDAKAAITITEYADPECPICKRFFETTEPRLLSEYIDNGRAKLEIKVENHIGPGSALASQAWYCANDQGKFRAYHDETYKRQKEFTAADLKKIAADLGLDQSVFASCLDSGRYAETVRASDQEADQLVTSTPTFFIGQAKLVGAQPFGVFRATIDAKPR